ncbi:MAG: hypothetical protein RLZ04_976 [Actinomycetota bacterium]|jgi:hypothetical protein
MTGDWNPLDPDAIRVVYDLRAWNFDQQAELASSLAEREIAHAWDGTDLVVPQDVEAEVDAVVADLEAALGVVYPDGDDDADDAGHWDAGITLDDGPTLSPVATLTEYELDEWPTAQREMLETRLRHDRIAYRWEGTTLVVHADEEEIVEAAMDDVEAGRGTSVGPADDGTLLEEMFLAAQRLTRDILDADALDALADLEASIDPVRPPFGVDPVLWHAAIGHFDTLVDALTAEEGADAVGALEAARALHDLLRSHV